MHDAEGFIELGLTREGEGYVTPERFSEGIDVENDKNISSHDARRDA